MVENEYKYVVDKDTFYKYLDFFEKIKLKRRDKTQVNYYYDTKDFSLLKNDSTIRIRQIDSNLELQVKEPRIISEFSSRNEYSEKIDRISDVLTINGNCYSLIGNLITHRTVFEIDDNTEVVFDTNHYYLVCDYEIEIEFSGKVPVSIMNIIAELDKNHLQKNSSKYKRFITGKIEFKKDMIL